VVPTVQTGSPEPSTRTCMSPTNRLIAAFADFFITGDASVGRSLEIADPLAADRVPDQR
jgi:hypothetical protein